MTDPDIPAQGRRYLSLGMDSNVKMKQTLIGVAFQRIGRAVTPRREAAKLHLAVLARQIAKRPRQFHVDADDVGRQTNQICHPRRHRDLIGHRLDGELEVGDDACLAGIDHVAAGLGAAENLAFDEAHPTGSANAGAAVMRKPDAVQNRAIEQQVAAIGVKCFAVESYFAESFASLHLDADRPHMPGMPDLAVVERRDPHEDAASERNVVWTAGIEAARDLERPMS